MGYNYWMSMHVSGDGRYWGNFLLNNPVTSSNGEHAMWLDGVKVSHLGQGFPNGYWSGGGGAIQVSSSTGSQDMKFDHVVVAASYIGCLPSGSRDIPVAPIGLIVRSTSRPLSLLDAAQAVEAIVVVVAPGRRQRTRGGKRGIRAAVQAD